MVTTGSSKDPDTPYDFSPVDPDDPNAAAVSSLNIAIMWLFLWPLIGFCCLCCVFIARQQAKKYKQALDSGLKAADAVSQGNYKEALNIGIKAAKAQI